MNKSEPPLRWVECKGFDAGSIAARDGTCTVVHGLIATGRFCDDREPTLRSFLILITGRGDARRRTITGMILAVRGVRSRYDSAFDMASLLHVVQHAA